MPYIENERTSSFLRVVVVDCSRELPTTLENEPLMLIFEDGSGGGGANEQPPSKMSRICSMLIFEDGVVVVVCRSRVVDELAVALPSETGLFTCFIFPFDSI